MYRRPDSVTAAGAILCFLGGITLIIALVRLPAAGLGSLTPDAATTSQIAAWVGVIGSVLTLVSGANVLRGENWARWLYLATCAGLLVYDFTFMADRLYALVPAWGIQAIIVVLLFLPNAGSYFRSASRRR